MDLGALPPIAHHSSNCALFRQIWALFLQFLQSEVEAGSGVDLNLNRSKTTSSPASELGETTRWITPEKEMEPYTAHTQTSSARTSTPVLRLLHEPTPRSIESRKPTVWWIPLSLKCWNKLYDASEDDEENETFHLAGGNVQLVTTFGYWEEKLSEAKNNGILVTHSPQRMETLKYLGGV